MEHFYKMHHQPKFLSILAISTVLGMAMIGTGLAGLTAPEKTRLEKFQEAKLEVAAPAVEVAAVEPVQVKEVKKLQIIGKKQKKIEEFIPIPEKIIVTASIIDVVRSYGEQAQEEMVRRELEKEKAAKLALEEEARKKEEELAKKIPNRDTYIKADTTIYGSLYKTANNAGIPDNITAGIIKALSHDVDFQRDIQRGNKLVALYEGTANYKGSVVKGKKLHYVKIELGKRDVEIYVTDNGFYYADGSSAKKSLLRTPIDGARITSGFGMRFHPILNYSKMHKGTDFGAGTGTPIYAAGNGTVVEAGKKGAYGNYVKIKHNGTYSTAYAHASRFAKGIKPGAKVSQGQVIAYVGTTGRSTGPHLHYELLKDGAQVNPTSVTNLNFANKLGGKELKQFKAEKEQLAAKLNKAPSTRTELAELVMQRSKEKDVAALSQ